MTVLASMVVYPPDYRYDGFFALLLLVGALAGAALPSQAARSRYSRVVSRVGVLGWFLSTIWALVIACDWVGKGVLGWESETFVRVLLRFHWPLHVSAAGGAWLLASLVAAAVIKPSFGGRRWVPLAAIASLAVLVFLVGTVKSRLDYGFPSYGEYLAAEEAKERAAGVGVAHNSWESLVLNRPEFLPATRWMPLLDLGMPVLAVAVAALFLIVRKRMAVGGAEVEELGDLRLPCVSLLLAGSLLWAELGVLSISQALKWASPLTPESMVEAAVVRNLVTPACTAVLGLVALFAWPRATGASPTGAGGRAPAPATEAVTVP